MEKEVVILLEELGGGVARVVSVLSEKLVKEGFKVYIIPTLQPKEEILSDQVSFPESGVSLYYIKNDKLDRGNVELSKKLITASAKIRIRISTKITGKASEKAVIQKRYGEKLYVRVQLFKRFLTNHPDAVILAFANQPAWITSLTLKIGRFKNKFIFSERSNPIVEASNRTALAFINRMFSRTDAMVFQTPDAMEWYAEKIKINGKVIFNPVKQDLPEPYDGVRKKSVVNFCRIDSPKNLPLLVEAFSKIHNEHPEYELYIYGDDAGHTPEHTVRFKQSINNSGCEQAIHILPARPDVHSVVNDFGMFVSSSDYEGMSNSMLEAMAMGLPTVCTDCPIGGARAIIRDHENGILTPVGDADALYSAMKEIAEDPQLARKLSENGRKIREQLSPDRIAEEWISLIESL